MARGHKVSVFNRGKTNPGLFSGVEHLEGDRNGQLDSLKNREWDAVIDNPATPNVVDPICRGTLDGTADAETTQAFLRRYALASEARAAQRIRFFDSYRAYMALRWGAHRREAPRRRGIVRDPERRPSPRDFVEEAGKVFRRGRVEASPQGSDSRFIITNLAGAPGIRFGYRRSSPKLAADR